MLTLPLVILKNGLGLPRLLPRSKLRVYEVLNLLDGFRAGRVDDSNF